MKYIIVILIALSLSACGEIKNWEINQAQEVCQNNEGVRSIHYFLHEVTVECNDGSTLILERPKIND